MLEGAEEMNAAPKFRRNITESEYEEIGPPRHKNGSGGRACDLCGSPAALLSCAACHQQLFCAACDEMYHKHPKRIDHQRVPLKSSPVQTASPVVEMPGPGPKAPPRRTRRAGGASAEPSPAPSRADTLSRKPSLPANPMAGRPLPPPPPGRTPPPILPKKSASLAQMSSLSRTLPHPKSVPMPGAQRDQWNGTLQTQPKKISNASNYPANPTGYPANTPAYPKSAGYPKPAVNGNGYPKSSNGGLAGYDGYPTVTAPKYPAAVPQPKHQQQVYPVSAQYPTLPNQQYPATRYPTAQQLNAASAAAHGYPAGYTSGGGGYPGGSGLYPAGYGGKAGLAQQQPNSTYHEDVSFPRQMEEYPASGGGGGGGRAARKSGRGRFANRVNRSSSLHDLARARLEPAATPDGAEGVRWKDEISQNQLPGMMGGGFARTTSTKSLHMLGDGGQGMMWNPGMWPGMSMQHGQFPQMLPGWAPMPGMMGMGGGGGINRSMHELNKAYLRPSSPSGSQKSTRSKKSNRSNKSTNSRRSKSNRHNHKDRSRNTSSSQSRNASRNSKKVRDRSLSTSASDDFFTGESDEEFVSISSNSDKAPRVSWTCEYCTYVNNPGVKVCVMCSKTTKLTAREESKSAKKEKSKKSRKKYAESSESEEDKRKGKSRNRKYSDSESEEEKSRRKKDKERSKAKKNISGSEDSELDEAIATYYAVRVDKNKGMSVREGNYNDSSSESASTRMKRPNFDAPAPAKGILKKASSNPALDKDGDGSELGGPVSEAAATISEDDAGMWRGEDEAREDAWSRQKEELKAWAQNQGRSQESPKMGTGGSEFGGRLDERQQDGRTEGRMYRAASGHSLAEPELIGQHIAARRGSEQVGGGGGGKRNFRSKRFSRTFEPMGLKRAQSFHMDQRRDGDSWLDQQRRTFYRANSKNSVNSEHFGGGGFTDSSDVEDPGLHFTSTVTSSTRGPGGGTNTDRGPGGIGSYLSRREFGSNEGQPAVPDSGYVSHSSGGGYPKMEVGNKNTIRSFTMSMDRGFLGAPPPPALLNKAASGSVSDFARFRSMEDLGPGKEKSTTQLLKLLREAEVNGFTSEDIQVAVNHCGEGSPVDWLKENWENMIETVMTLASNVGHEAEENTVGTISKEEAKVALREHKGNIWISVQECVQRRQKMYDELMGRGKFAREDAVTMLTAHHGDVNAAFQELNKAQLKPFLARLWGRTDGQTEPQPQQPDNPEEDEEEVDGDAFEDAASQGEQEAQVEEVEEEPEPEPVEVKPALTPEQLKVQRQVRRLVAEGKVTSFPQGEIVVRLCDEGFPEDESLLAVQDESLLAVQPEDQLDSALALLRRECELCATQMNIKEVIRMVNCDHSCCQDCAANFFAVVIKDQNISQAVCPFCQSPGNLAEDDDVALTYYAKLDILLKDILEKDVHDLFQRKLRDRTLMKDPNFKWCYKCPFGFLADPKNKKLVCPDCRAMSCAKCLLPWEPQHEGTSCQDFARWKEENDPDAQAAGLEQHMAEHGISCPACNFRYTLTKGGCMHFTCSQCKFEFCIGCKKAFKLGTRCGRDPSCAKMGLHAHHPRNCLFYLRDKEPRDLQNLLKKNKVEFDNAGEVATCRVQVQKEGADALVDGTCDEATEKGHAGYCRIHYVEYLCDLIIKNKMEVVSLMELGEIKAVFTRAGKFIPAQRPGEYEFKYTRRLAQVVEQEIPLDSA